MSRSDSSATKVLALSGGVGGAKLVLGLARVCSPGRLHVLTNVGDDFEHFGLSICPDIDTIVYTLAGLADAERGWGRRDETWSAMEALARIGAPTWFQLGDADLAMHLERTRRRAEGASLSAITDTLRRRLGVRATIWPATDNRVRTRVRTDHGWLAFQEYFVARRCEPVVRALEYEGAAQAGVVAPALALFCDPALQAVVICPSNPVLSIEPMLAMPALREALVACRAPVIAVSPIVRGEALKGPTAKLLRELGRPVDALEAARRYSDFLDGYVVEAADAPACRQALDIPVLAAQTVMDSDASKERLAHECLRFADTLRARRLEGTTE